MKLDWEVHGGGPTGIVVERRTEGAESVKETWSRIAKLPATSTEYSDSSLKKGERFALTGCAPSMATASLPTPTSCGEHLPPNLDWECTLQFGPLGFWDHLPNHCIQGEMFFWKKRAFARSKLEPLMTYIPATRRGFLSRVSQVTGAAGLFGLTGRAPDQWARSFPGRGRLRCDHVRGAWGRHDARYGGDQPGHYRGSCGWRGHCHLPCREPFSLTPSG